MKFFLLWLLIPTIVAAQETFQVSAIPEALFRDANSIVQEEILNVEIHSTKKMTYTKTIVMTVLNKRGDAHVPWSVSYDPSTRIKHLEMLILDEHGEQIEKIRKKDFYDLSAVEGGTLYSDSRQLGYYYETKSYPYTVVLNYRKETDNTAFIPPFYPSGDYGSSVVASSYQLLFDPEVELDHMAFDKESIITLEQSGNLLKASASMLPARTPELGSPNLTEVLPHVLFRLKRFHLEGLEGVATNWELFGQWMNDNLLSEGIYLTAGTKQKMQNLVANATSLEERARIVYEYVQQHTRYISVQIGLGGWKPTPASEVDLLGYGDCKGLTNYTKALLHAVDVPSYYTIVHAGTEQQDILESFPSFQGNHIILAVPTGDDMIWLECTNQETPFGYLGNFTDDRDVLMITPEGGQIAHTVSYQAEESLLVTGGNCVLSSDGELNAQVSMKSKGIQYNNKYGIDNKPLKDQKAYYQRYFDYIDNLEMIDIGFSNDREAVIMTEEVSFRAKNYATPAGDNLIVNINMLNRATFIPKKYKNRRNPLHLYRGYTDQDEFNIQLPEGYQLLELPQPLEIESEFGTYHSDIQRNEDGTLVYRRTLQLVSGTFPKESYEDYRKFRRKIAKHDNQKIILTKS